MIVGFVKTSVSEESVEWIWNCATFIRRSNSMLHMMGSTVPVLMDIVDFHVGSTPAAAQATAKNTSVANTKEA